MVEVRTAWSGWSGAKPDGQCLPLLIFLAPESLEVVFWHRLTWVVPEKGLLCGGCVTVEVIFHTDVT